MSIAAFRSRLSTQDFTVVEVTPMGDVLVTETVLETLPTLSSACVILWGQDHRAKTYTPSKGGGGDQAKKHQEQ